MPSLADAHIEAQARLRVAAATTVAAVWQRLPSYDEENVPTFVTAAGGVVLAAQRTSVALTNAYVARRLGRQPVPLDADGILAAQRGDTTPDVQWRRPFVTVWTALANGTPWEQATASGLERATGMAAMDVQLASRASFAAVQQADPAIRGYERVADPGACAFCSMIDGAFVKSADAMPLHNNCGCSLSPVLTDRRPTPVPAGVVVHEHGELGPVLADPAHSFISEHDL